MFFKSKVLVACLAISALTAFGIGCGDDGDDNGGGGAFTSVEGSAEVGSLEEADAKQLCEDSQSYMESKAPSDVKEKGCTLSGTFSASFAYASDQDLDAAKAACVAGRDACLEDDQPTETNDPCKDAATEYDETCTATVDEYVACQEAQTAASLEMFNNIKDCDDLTVEDLTADTQPTEPPAACVTFQEKCPAAAQ